MRTASIAIAAIAGAMCAYIYFLSNIDKPVRAMAAPSDFTHYYQAGQAILHGKSPFDDPDFLYPPAVAFLAAPLAVVNYVRARWIWLVLSQACLLAAAVLLWLGIGRDLTAFYSVVVVWTFGGAAAENFVLGQIGPVLTLLLVLAYTRNAESQGVATGVGFSLKYVPGVLAAAFALQQNRRAIAAFLISSVLFLLIPWIVILYAFPGARAPAGTGFSMGTPALLNWSLPATVLRALDPPHSEERLPRDWEFGNMAGNLHLTGQKRTISIVIATATLAAGLAVLVWISGGQLNAHQMPFALAGLISLILAAAPICWTHYQILQYPGVALLLTHATRRRQWISAVAILGCAALLYPIPVAMLAAYYHANNGWTAGSPALLYLWTSVAPLASLALFGFLLRDVRTVESSRLSNHLAPVLER